jgi:hypothetical protein
VRIRYYLDSNGVGRVLTGTPAKLAPGDDMTLIFEGAVSPSAVCVNRKRYAVQGNAALVAAEKISAYNDITLQCTADGVTKTYALEPLMERDGYLVGRDEHSGHYLELKQATVALTKLTDELSERVTALEKKCAKLEYKLDGTDIFDLND